MGDNMQHVWSPWRMEYIRKGISPEGCIFCDALAGEDGVDNLIVYHSQHAFVILNRYPYTSGHVMVVPTAHLPTLDGLGEEAIRELFKLVRTSMHVIETLYKPDGFNLGANLGSKAGAGVADHVHFHIVPRWAGDTNFMTSVGQARVLPEDLCETYQRLKNGWPKG